MRPGGAVPGKSNCFCWCPCCDEHSSPRFSTLRMAFSQPSKGSQCTPFAEVFTRIQSLQLALLLLTVPQRQCKKFCV